MTSSSPKLMFFVSVDWFFCSHFLERAMAARNAGYDVVVVTDIGEHGDRITRAGLRPIHLKLDRRSVNPILGLMTLIKLIRILRTEKPDILHQVALKPILIGTLAARICKVPHLINAIVGGGYIFSSEKLLARALRALLALALKSLLNPIGSKVVFENRDDLTAFVQKGYVRERDAVLIAGAGVDPGNYQRADLSSSSPLVVLVARLLWDKGIGEFVEAARQIRDLRVSARFVVVGDVDPANRAAIDASVINAWKNEGYVEFWGFRTDMANVLKQASIACLPSYREGLPKSLLEAMAAGLPCVTTDVPGCRSAVRDGDNGLLVQPRDAQSLAAALIRLIRDVDLRQRMGNRGLDRVTAEFSSTRVIEQTLLLYRQMGAHQA